MRCEGTRASGALFDETGTYRYLLWRTWDGSLPPVAWILLNPSTAGATADDPTLRRCAGFARAWGHGGVLVANLFAWRATGPRALRTAGDPVGPDNDRILVTIATSSTLVVAGWGAGGRLHGRDAAVTALLRPAPLHALAVNRDGSPRHPLYAPGSASPVCWRWRAPFHLRPLPFPLPMAPRCLCGPPSTPPLLLSGTTDR